MKILCVLNPESGGGTTLQRWPHIAALLDSFKVEYQLLAEKNVPVGAQAVAALENADDGEYDVMVGIGGDGTHSSIINAIMRYKKADPSRKIPPYSIIPMGTGNDISKSIGLDSRADFFTDDLRRAVATAIYGADYMMDVGVFNEKYFLDALTIGIDSRILREHNKQAVRIKRFPMIRRVMRGYFLYFLCVGPRFWRHRLLNADIIVDGKLWYSGPVINLIVNNTRVYGGTFVFSRDTYANDGLLDVVVFTDRRDYLMKCLLALRTNPSHIRKLSERSNAALCHIQARSLQIRLSRSEAAQIDGEVINAGDSFDISVLAGAIHMKTPVEPE